MRAFIRSTGWDRMQPNVIRMELEVPMPDNGDSMGIRMLAGNQVHIYGESRWERFVNKLKGGKQ